MGAAEPERKQSRCFEGPSRKAKDLIIDDAVARRLLDADEVNKDFVRPYHTRSEITDSPTQCPSRWGHGLRTAAIGIVSWLQSGARHRPPRREAGTGHNE